MAADFRLKQNLKMSPNAQIKNLVPENLSDVPAESDWKLGRIWFNTSIGKLQGVFLKLDKVTGLPVEPEEWEVRIVGADALGPTKDGGYWPDGLFDFTEQTKIADAMDDVNEALKDLSPPEATLLRGNLVMVDQELKTGKVSKTNGSAPHQLNMVGLTEGAQIDYIISNPVVTATLPTDGLVVKGKQQQQFGRADQGIIKVVVDDLPVDAGLNLKSLFNEPSRDHFGIVQGYDPEVNQTIVGIDGVEKSLVANPNKLQYKSSTGALTINTVERYNDFKKWQRGTGTVKYNPTPGRHTIRVEHDGIISGSHLNAEIPTDPFKTNDMVVFYDPSTVAPTTQITSLILKTGNTKYVSGVPYFNNNITFSVNFKADDVFNYTYWDKPISLSMNGTTAGLMEWNHNSSNLSGLSVPLWNDVFSLNGYVIRYTASASMTDRVTLTTKAGKPTTGWGPETTASLNVLIDTNPENNNSTSLKETFLDEEYRMKIGLINTGDVESVKSNTKGTWVSSVPLQSGEAQQTFGTLVKAKSKYDDYNVAVDYTAYAGITQEYYRRIYTQTNKPNSNGKLKIKTTGIVGTDFDIFIKLPSLTGWMNISEHFDLVTFSNNRLSDGIGCGTGYTKTTDGYEFPWTAGNLSTINSGFGYLVRVVLKTNNFKITEIEEISENWR